MSKGAGATAALALGWSTAELYNYDQIPGEGEGRDRRSLVGLGRLSRQERASLLLRQMLQFASDLGLTLDWHKDASQALAGEPVEIMKLQAVVWSGHKDVLLQLTSADTRLGRAYGLGRELAETTLLAKSDDRGAIAEQMNKNRIITLEDDLGDLADCLPPSAAGTVAASLRIWCTWADTISAAPEWGPENRRLVGQALRRQDTRWRALLLGETDPRRSLTPTHYVAAGRRLVTGIARVIYGLVADSRPVRWSLIVTVALAGIALLVGLTGHVPATLVGSLVFVATFVTSGAGLVSIVRQAVTQMATPLWEAELEIAMADANTVLPVIGAEASKLPKS